MIIIRTEFSERWFYLQDEYEKDIHIPADIHTAVKALHYALKHPVVNNHTMRLEALQKPFLPYKRVSTGPSNNELLNLNLLMSRNTDDVTRAFRLETF